MATSEWVRYGDPRDGRELKYRRKHNLKIELKRSGISQETFANMMGVTRKTLNEWLSGESYMANAYIIKAAALLGVEPAYLLDLQTTGRVSDDEQRHGGRHYQEKRDAIKQIYDKLKKGDTEFCAVEIEDDGSDYFTVLELEIDRETGIPWLCKRYYDCEEAGLDSIGGSGEYPEDENRKRLLKKLNELCGDYRDMAELSRCTAKYLTETFAAYSPQLFSRLSPILRDFAHDYPICVTSQAMKNVCPEQNE